MNRDAALEKLIAAYEIYYDVQRSGAEDPFAVRATFHSHGEKYVLVRQAKIWEMDSHEYVFIYAAERAGLDELYILAETAWLEGLSQVCPSFSHRNSDVTLILLADHIEPEVFPAASRLKKSRSYFLSLQGWSNLRIAAYELSSGNLACNRQGQDLRQLFGKLF